MGDTSQDTEISKEEKKNTRQIEEERKKQEKENVVKKQLESLKFYDINLNFYFKKDNKFNLPYKKPIELPNLSKKKIRINSVNHLLEDKEDKDEKISIPILNDKTNIIVLENLLFENKKIWESINENNRKDDKFNHTQLFIKHDKDDKDNKNVKNIKDISNIFQTILGTIYDIEKIGLRSLRDNIPPNDKNIVDIINKSKKSRSYIQYVTKNTNDNNIKVIYESSVYLNVYNILNMYFNDTNSYINYDYKWYKFNKINPIKFNDENIPTFNISEDKINVSFEIDDIEELVPKFDIKYQIKNLKDIDDNYNNKIEDKREKNEENEPENEEGNEEENEEEKKKKKVEELEENELPIYKLTVKNLTKESYSNNLYIDYFTNIEQLRTFDMSNFLEIFKYNNFTNINLIDIFTNENIFNLYSLVSTDESRKKYFRIIDKNYHKNSSNYKEIIKDIKTDFNKLHNENHEPIKKIKLFLTKIIFRKQNVFYHNNNMYYIKNVTKDDIIINEKQMKDSDYIKDILKHYDIKVKLILKLSRSETYLETEISDIIKKVKDTKYKIQRTFSCPKQALKIDRKLLKYYIMLGLKHDYLHDLIIKQQNVNKEQKGGKIKKYKTIKYKTIKYKTIKNKSRKNKTRKNKTRKNKTIKNRIRKNN